MAGSDIERAAIRWLSLRDRCRVLRGQRGICYCDRERVEESDGKDRRPCWKHYEYDAAGDGGLADRKDWCRMCRNRQEIHDELTPLAASRGAALRNLIRLTRIARATTDPA